MLPYDPKFPEEQSDIKELLEKRNISPQTVADFLKDHPHMYFGTADLTKDFARIILYSASIGQDKLAIFIAQEFSNEIDIGSSQVVEAMKKLYRYESFLKEMTRVASKDVDILKVYFPEASNIFLF